MSGRAMGKMFWGFGYLAIIALPLIVDDRYFQHLLVTALIFVIFSSSWNLLAGYTGLLNLGHAAFFGIGGYTSALLVMHLGLPGWLGLIFGAFMSAFAGFLLGIPSLRLSGPFLAITTIGFAEILHMVAMNWVDLTRGSLGLYGIPPLEGFLGIKFTNELSYYYVCLSAATLTIYCFWRLTHSEFGLTLKSMREDEPGASSIGIDVSRYKLCVFTISAFFGGLAGGLFAHYQRLLSPDILTLPETFTALAMTMIGGLGTIAGPVIGAVFLTFFSEGLRFVEDLIHFDIRMIVYGLMLVLTILFFPGGIMGFLTKLRIFNHKKTDG
jgi:branched-chain amino acid transport system permease protein